MVRILSAIPVTTIEVEHAEEGYIVAITSDLPEELRWSERVEVAEQRSEKAARVAVASFGIGPIEA